MRVRIASLIGICALACPAGLGQDALRPKMKPVDAGVADMGPLSGPGRVLSPGLRQPSGFDRVYEVEIDGKKYYARQNGAMVAVFPRSSYQSVRGSATPVVPAGTTFYLNGLPDNARPISPEEMPSNYAGRSQDLAKQVKSQDTRVDLSAGALSAKNQPAAKTRSLDVPASSGSVWQSEAYRVQRTGELIDAALAAQTRRGA
ncbi:MAG: hypothetical protein KF805_08160 [Phycisphaeraceae bacterium]|nr:hypothetical protein [Phycisphaeraceae bacterium]